jgi:predicted branched-subunit amino acid permease
MVSGQHTPHARRYAFWTTAIALFAMWNAGTLVGAIVGHKINPANLGLDVAAPAIFTALLWPHFSRARSRAIAAVSAVAAFALIPLTPAGVPVLAAAAVAVAAAFAPPANEEETSRR